MPAVPAGPLLPAAVLTRPSLYDTALETDPTVIPIVTRKLMLFALPLAVMHTKLDSDTHLVNMVTLCPILKLIDFESPLIMEISTL